MKKQFDYIPTGLFAATAVAAAAAAGPIDHCQYAARVAGAKVIAFAAAKATHHCRCVELAAHAKVIVFAEVAAAPIDQYRCVVRPPAAAVAAAVAVAAAAGVPIDRHRWSERRLVLQAARDN